MATTFEFLLFFFACVCVNIYVNYNGQIDNECQSEKFFSYLNQSYPYCNGVPSHSQ